VTPTADPGDRSRAARLARHGAVSTALSLLSDRQLAGLVAAAPVVGTGIGGTARLLRVEGVPVFVKRVPLTDLERRPENVRSTANLFGLPPFCHYGLGSAGGGVWRELAAHVMTTDWVVSGRAECFPLLHHWRVLDGPPPAPPTAAQRAGLEASVAFWDGSAAVRERLDALAAASAGVVLFCEHVPHNLSDWLTARTAEGPGALAAACALVDRHLRADVATMNSGGLLHFDAHFGNILTDGDRLYLADFGLAASPRFDLSPDEAAFVAANAGHDAHYVVTELVNWLVHELAGTTGRAERVAYVRRVAGGDEPERVPGPADAIVRRYAPVAAVMNDFYGALRHDSLAMPFPAAELAAAGAAMGFTPVP
jgi:hypothetical protein